MVTQTNHIHPPWRDCLLSTLSQTSTSYEIWGSHSDNKQDYSVLWKDAIWLGTRYQHVRIIIYPYQTHTHVYPSPENHNLILQPMFFPHCDRPGFMSTYTQQHIKPTLNCTLTIIHCELCEQNLSSTLEMSKSCNTSFINCNIQHQEHQFRLFHDTLIHYATSCNNLLKHYQLITFSTCTLNVIYGENNTLV
jgi:hypothetical protein